MSCKNNVRAGFRGSREYGQLHANESVCRTNMPTMQKPNTPYSRKIAHRTGRIQP